MADRTSFFWYCVDEYAHQYCITRIKGSTLIVPSRLFVRRFRAELGLCLKRDLREDAAWPLSFESSITVTQHLRLNKWSLTRCRDILSTRR